MSFDADQMGKLRRFFHELSLDPRGGAPNAALALDGTQRALALGLARVKRDSSEPLLDGPFGRLVEGWNAYFSGAYEQARAAFEAGEDVSADWQSWRSLGLGKVASDLGHWRLAASWLQRAMGQAEQQNDTVRMAEAAGALGEVLVRAGHPLSALDLFTFDRALLPPGSAHAGRLRNYQMVALGRGQSTRETTEAAFWETFYTSIERDHVSAAFALGSLHLLSYRARSREIFERASSCLDAYGPRLRSNEAGSPVRLPAAFMHIVRAGWACNFDDATSSAEAEAELCAAMELLREHYPFELLWVKQRLKQDNAAAWEELTARRAPNAPPAERRPSLLTSWVSDLSLPDGTAFAKLADASHLDWTGADQVFL